MYFNLIIRADESQAVHHSRMFEYTAPEVKRLFEWNGKPDLKVLCDLPTIMVKEFGPDTGKQTARIGYIDSPSMCPTMKNPILQFSSDLLIEKQILGDNSYTPRQLEWVGQHTGWSVFEGDPFRLLFGHRLPEVNNLFPPVLVDENQVAVMMPFDEDPSIDPVFKAIKDGVAAVGKQAVRVDELKASTEIPDDVRRLIRSSCAVVVDLTELNSNVLYELGFADALEKQIILIQKGEISGLPFDFAARRVFPYRRDAESLKRLSQLIQEVVSSIK